LFVGHCSGAKCNPAASEQGKIMRVVTALLIAAMALCVPALPAAASSKQHAQRYEYEGRYYKSVAQCRQAKRKARKNGAIVGAAVAGVGAVVLGANLGKTALIAGGGALVGNQLGKSKKC
jgi:hypothetical protein